MKKILSKLFGFKYVLLYDHNGECNVRRVLYKFKDKMVCNRYVGTKCTLYPDGVVRGPIYVSKWEPFIGFEED